MNKVSAIFFLFLFTVSSVGTGFAQDKFILNLASLNGQKLAKTNLHKFTIINSSNKSESVIVKGSIRLRSSKSRLSYQYQAILKPGSNQMSDLARSITYTYSSSSLERLFKQHGVFPNGEFEYCVDLFELGGEGVDALGSDCIYDENQDLFLINLMEPEDKAKIDELYPMFSWSVNSPLMNELIYKMRVAEVKDGQRPNNAIMRNRPVYEQAGLRFPTQNYPVTAKSLEYFQPYAWTVDAYYKDILMGSAETWEFVIINDSLMEGVPRNPSYIEVNVENGTNTALLLGKMKLKYIEKDVRKNILSMTIRNAKGKIIKAFKRTWDVGLGENRTTINLYQHNLFKHAKFYSLEIRDVNNKTYKIRFQYFNPDFSK